MITESDQIVVTNGELLFGPGIHATRVQHRTLPVVCGEGATTREAAKDLVRKLMRESSSVSGWHLKDLETRSSPISGRFSPRPTCRPWFISSS